MLPQSTVNPWIPALINLFAPLIVLYGPAVLFSLTQRYVLRLIPPENRELKPGLVWLQLIPVFNFYWIFIVVTRIADSISKQNVAFQDDTILGISGYDAVEAIGRRPTYKIGIAWCVLFILEVFQAFSTNGRTMSTNTRQVDWPTLLLAMNGLSLLTCWIIYWVQLALQIRKLKALRPDL